MIDKALVFLRDELNYYLKSKMKDSADKVDLSAVVNEKGNVEIDAKTVGLTLINVEEERTFRAQAPVMVGTDGNLSSYNPEIKLNLYILLAANHSDHKEALVLLSYVILFFQSHTVFDSNRYPQLGTDIGKLVIEMSSLTFEQQNQLWASLGAKYMPSVVYKVRMLIVQEQAVGSVTPAIKSIDKEFASSTE
jgi:hypothetical protein